MSGRGLKSRRPIAAVLFVLALAFTAPALPAQTDQARRLAPTGELRVALVMSDSILVKQNPQGQFGGVLIDIANLLAARLGVEPKPVPYQNIVHFNQSIGKDEWDLAIVPRDLSRIERLGFSEPVLEVQNGYVARPGSLLVSSDDVDRTGVKVAVTEHSPADDYLSRTLKKATIVRLPRGLEEAREALMFARADVYADYAQTTELVAAEVPGATSLVGRFNFVRLTFAVPKANAAALSGLNEFIHDIKHDGTLAETIKRAGLRGVGVGH